MRLSDAVRLGSMLKPQTVKELWGKGTSCALGAACDAVGIAEQDSKFATHSLGVEFPILHRAVRCPACGLVAGFLRRRRGDEFDFEDVIIHLNDDHEWKRERIADWIAGLEPRAEPASVNAVDPVGQKIAV